MRKRGMESFKQRKGQFSRKRKGQLSRKRKVLVAALAAGSVAVVAAPAHAANIATCEFSTHIKLTGHGLTVSEILAGASGTRKTTFESDRVGYADCVGKVAGHTVSGYGPAVISGAYQAAPLCVRGVGTGDLSISVPRFLAFFGQGHENLDGSFGLEMSGASWRQVGQVADATGQTTSFSALSRLTPDSGQGCLVRAGTLSGRIVIGGTYTQQQVALKKHHVQD